MEKIRTVLIFFIVWLLILTLSKSFAQTGQALDSWVSMAPAVPTGNGDGACIVYAEKDGFPKIYNIRGGTTGFGIYDINTNVWISTTPLPYSATNGAGMAWDGGNFIYILLGGTTFYQYDISAATFTRLADPPFSVGPGGAIVYVSTSADAKWCYVLRGGGVAGGPFARYNILTNSWEMRTNYGAAVSGGGSLVWDGANYIYGMRHGAVTNFRRYDINTDSAWVTLTAVPVSIGAGGSLVFDGVITSSNIYATRGAGESDFLKYNIMTNQWVKVSSAPATIGANSGQRLARYGDYFYCRRGSTDNSFWRYRWRDLDAPGKITGFAAKTGTVGGTIRLSWISPGNDGYTGALPAGSTFYIQYSSLTGVNFSTAATTATDRFHIWIPTGPVIQGTTQYWTVGSLIDGVTYYFRIWARDNAGNWSTISDGATAWAQISLPPASAPTDLSSRPLSPTTILLTWSLSDAATYWVEHSSVPSPYNWLWRSSVPAPGNSYTDINLIPGTTYWHRLIAVNAAGVPNYTSPSNITSTLTYTAAPIGFTKTAVSTTLIMWSWTPVGFADGFRIYQATSPTTVVATVPFSQTSYEETGLSQNTAYGRFVRAYNIMGESLDSNHATFYTLAAIPADLSVVAVYQTSVTLQWSANTNPGYTKYGAAFATDQNFTVNHTTFATFTDNLTALTTTVFGLSGGTTYYFRVWAYNGDGVRTDYSNIVSTVTQPGVPGRPINFTGYALGVSSVVWHWDITPSATFYQLYDETHKLIRNLEPGGNTTYFETGLSVNTKYSRYVKAGNEYGLSPPTTLKSIYTFANPPTNLTVIGVTHSSVSLSWSANDNPLGTKYEVSMSIDNFTTNFSTPIKLADNHTQTTAEIIGLSANTTYWFRVRAFNGDSRPTGFTLPVSTTTSAPPPPPPPPLPRICGFEDIGDTLAYTKVGSPDDANDPFGPTTSNPRSGAKSFEVRDISKGGEIIFEKVNVSGYTDVKIHVWIDTNWGGFESTDEICLYYNVDNTTFTRWLRLFDDAGTSPLPQNWTEYSLYIGTATTIQLKITMKNNADTEIFYFDDISITGTKDTTPPAAISNLTALTGINEGEIILQWTSPGDDGNTGILNNAKYRIKWSTTSFSSFRRGDYYNVEFSTTNVAPGTAVSYVITGLKPGTTYYFGIITCDDAGNWSVWNKDAQTNTANYAQALDLPPSPPRNISALSENRTVVLTWQHPSPDPGDINEYRIYQATFSFTSLTDGNVVHIRTVSYPATAITIMNLINGMTYFYRIKTLDKYDKGDGYYGEALVSSLSDIVSATPRIRPPSNLIAIHKGTTVSLSWTHSPDHTADNFAGYNIYRSSISIDGPYSLIIHLSTPSPNSHDDIYQIDSTKIYYYFICSSDTAGPESVPSNVATATPDLLPPKFVEVTELDSRSLGKAVVKINIRVTDDKFSIGDNQGKIKSVAGKYRKINSLEEKDIEITGVGLNTPSFSGEGKLDFSVFVITDEGIEYYLEAKDEVNTTRWPFPGAWYKVRPPTDKPEQKFITPSNPEVVFGREVEEVIIRDVKGNEIWKGNATDGRIIVWCGEDKEGKKVELGPYIYQLRTKDGKRKYGVVIVVK